MTERQKIIAWLRRQAADFGGGADAAAYQDAADAIEEGEHLRKPEPTIPSDKWVKEPSAR